MVFQPVTCGVICGEFGTYLFQGGNYRDTDWYGPVYGPGNYSGMSDGFILRLFTASSASAPLTRAPSPRPPA